MRPFLLLVCWLFAAFPALGSHAWSDVDICQRYEDTLPPGLHLEDLPQPQSPGAMLLDQYCTQCHNLPGPDRHTAAEWQQLVPQMIMLMEVSSRFAGLNGQVETMTPAQQTSLEAYLNHHAASTPSATPAARSSLPRIWALGPVLLVCGLGLGRWWYRHHQQARQGDRKCA